MFPEHPGHPLHEMKPCLSIKIDKSSESFNPTRYITTGCMDKIHAYFIRLLFPSIFYFYYNEKFMVHPVNEYLKEERAYWVPPLDDAEQHRVTVQQLFLRLGIFS